MLDFLNIMYIVQKTLPLECFENVNNFFSKLKEKGQDNNV